MFKAAFTRITNMIKKTFLIIMITRVILIIETIFTSIKLKQNTIFKKFICYNCDKIDYYRKNCIVQD